MVSLFDKIKIILGKKANGEDKTEPIVSQPKEFQGNGLADNKVYYGFLRGASELQMQTEVVAVQSPELTHTSELGSLKYYAELAKQNKLDSNELNEDLD